MTVPVIMLAISPLYKILCNLSRSFNPNASETNGVIADENPMPKDITKKIVLFAKDMVAKATGPNFPTMMLSAKPTKT